MYRGVIDLRTVTEGLGKGCSLAGTSPSEEAKGAAATCIVGFESCLFAS